MRGSAFCAVLAVLILPSGAARSYEDENGDIIPQFLSSSVDLTVVVGDTVTFPCETEIPENISIVWNKLNNNENSVTEINDLHDDRFQIVNRSSLQISDVVPTDSGYYSCEINTKPRLKLFHSLKVKSHPRHSRRCSGKSEKWIDLAGDYCYLIERDKKVTWIEAVYQCFLAGGSLATLQSMEELKRIRRYLRKTNLEERLYIGLWKHNDGQFEWVDKSPSTFRNWGPGEPNKKHRPCVEIYLKYGTWHGSQCDKIQGYMCYALKNHSLSIPRKVCPHSSPDWTDLGTEYCYIIDYYNETTSEGAAEQCSAAGGSLASFHSVEEISVMRNQIKHQREPMHIGLRRNSDGMFEWMDRSPFDLEFWNTGEPSDKKEKCGQMYPNSGLWNDIQCTRDEGYICSTPKVKPEFSATESPLSSVGEICGGEISAEHGTIQSPHYPENYNPNGNCFWKITVPNNYQIQLSFHVLQLEYGADCEFDYVEILDGVETGNPILPKLCGSQNQHTVFSPSNIVSVKFLSDQQNQRIGFLAEFQAVPKCGGIIIAEEGVIQTRSYPHNYEPNDACTWKITVPENNAVLLMFQAFEIEDSAGCGLDFVEVLDGHDPNSKVLGRYCGYDIPDEIRSSGHKMTIRFGSDDSTEYFGFLADFKRDELNKLLVPIQPPEVQRSPCEKSIDYVRGTLNSPYYPDYSTSKESCVWTITAPEGSTISFKRKVFELERSEGCNYDYVAVYDGPEVSHSELLKKFCEYTEKEVVTSSGNEMTVNYIVSYITASRGRFAATFSINESKVIESEELPKESCEKHITSDEGNIYSPNYPKNYGPSEKCIWKITVPIGYQVELKFNDFKVETHIGCDYDYVLIRDGHEPRSRILAKLCGYEIPREIRSSENKLMIDFKSDSSSEYSGFSAEFKKDLPVASSAIPSYELGDCGGEIYAAKGTIHSPNYPSSYGPLQECIWKITVPEGHLAFLKFQSIKLEFNRYCTFDRVTVLDGNDVDSPVLNMLCTDANLPEIVSSKNKITVNFTSDDSFEGQGFAATFGKILPCGGNIVAGRGVLESPNTTDGTGYKCTWSITVPDDYDIMLKIYVDPKKIYRSPIFSVTTHDGPVMSSHILNQYNSLDRMYWAKSTSNTMFVIATSAGSHELPRFYAEFQKDDCGRYISKSSGVISSPNYPDSYPPNETCTWAIVVPENQQVLLKFQSFELQDDSCIHDFVTILDGYPSDGFVLGKVCGQNKPENFRSTRNVMSLRFVSDSAIEYQGFSAQFENATCSFNIIGERKMISTPGFPRPYPKNSECTWNITVPVGNTVTLQFISFSTESSTYGDCFYDFLEIFDGHDGSNSSLLATLCGEDLPDTVRSSTNKISLRFVSDGTTEKNGFQAEVFGEPTSFTELQDTSHQPLQGDK